MSHLSAVNVATGRLGVSTHALLLRLSNHIYSAAVALSQSKVHDADRPSPSAAPIATAGSYAARSEMLRTEKGRRKGTESAQRDKPLDGLTKGQKHFIRALKAYSCSIFLHFVSLFRCSKSSIC